MGREVGVEGRFLEDDTDLAADQVAPRDHIVAGDFGTARSRTQQSAQHSDRGRLARTIGTKESEYRAARHDQIDAGDGPRYAVILVQTLGPYRHHDRVTSGHRTASTVWNMPSSPGSPTGCPPTSTQA